MVEYIYKCDHCGKEESYRQFKSRKYNIEIYIIKGICKNCIGKEE